MRLYLIAILVTFAGLWICSVVQADELCGLRTSHLFSVESWKAETGLGDEIYYTVTLKSSPRIALDQPVVAHAETTIHLVSPVSRGTQKLVSARKNKVTALACIDSIDYVDGSGTIIN
jgi:hypothetical protein